MSNSQVSLIDFLNEGDVFAAHSGIQLTEISKGKAVAQMTVGSNHLNAGGVCQGGVLFTLADLAVAGVMNSRGKLTFSVQSSISFVRSATVGDRLTAEATEVNNHPKLPTIDVRIFNQDKQLIATLTAIGYRKDKPIP